MSNTTKDIVKSVIVALAGSIIFFGVYFTVTTIVSDHENLTSVINFLNSQIAASQKAQQSQSAPVSTTPTK